MVEAEEGKLVRQGRPGSVICGPMVLGTGPRRTYTLYTMSRSPLCIRGKHTHPSDVAVVSVWKGPLNARYLARLTLLTVGTHVHQQAFSFPFARLLRRQ